MYQTEAELFSKLDDYFSFRYVLCDIYFDPELKSAYDEELFSLMGRMRRIVVPKHNGAESLPSQIESKEVFSDYKTNVIEDNLMKYQFLQHKEKSIPFYMWNELTGGEIKRRPLRYLLNGEMATNSVILDFPVRLQAVYNSININDYF